MYGSAQSYFAAKLRAYLNYKKLDFEEKPFSIFDLRWRLPRNTGSSGIPAVETSGGEWLSDTTDIINELERRHPEPIVATQTPLQTIASMLIEAWSDDVWLPVAVHTRWSYPENYPLFRHVVGKGILPGAPRCLQNWVVDNTAARFVKGKMEDLGVTHDQTELLDRWTESLLDLFDAHFSQHAYLFGGRPTIADFALIGPFHGHLYTDPVPKLKLIDPRPNLRTYIEKAHSGEATTSLLIAEDEIPYSLIPVLQVICSEFLPALNQIVSSIRELIEYNKLSSGDPIPRFIPDIRFPMKNSYYTRVGFSYSCWMMQRIQHRFNKYPECEQTKVTQWFEKLGQPDFLVQDFGPAFVRDGLGVKIA